MSLYFALYTVENNKNKKSVKFQGDMLNCCNFIQVYVFTTNHHLKTRLNPPRCAVIRELGWEPIHDFLYRQRLSYISRLQALPDSRLCKTIYTELMTLSDGARESWNYSSYIKNLISNYDVNTDEINTICLRELQKRISSISTES